MDGVVGARNSTRLVHLQSDLQESVQPVVHSSAQRRLFSIFQIKLVRSLEENKQQVVAFSNKQYLLKVLLTELQIEHLWPSTVQPNRLVNIQLRPNHSPHLCGPQQHLGNYHCPRRLYHGRLAPLPTLFKDAATGLQETFERCKNSSAAVSRGNGECFIGLSRRLVILN